MRYVVDRIEDNFIIVESEDGKFIDVPISFAPNVSEGDILEVFIKKEEANSKKKRIGDKLGALFKG